MTAQEFDQQLKELVKLMEHEPSLPVAIQSAIDRLIKVVEIFESIKANKAKILSFELKPRWKDLKTAQNMRERIFKKIEEFANDVAYLDSKKQDILPFAERLYIHLPERKTYRSLSEIQKGTLPTKDLEKIQIFLARKLYFLAFSFSFDFFGKQEKN